MATADEANEILADVRRASGAVRSRRPSRAVPLLVFGLVVLAAMPFYVRMPLVPGSSSEVGGSLPPPLQGPFDTRAGAWTAWYWIVALPAGYAFCAWWYRRAALRCGVGVSVRALVITGLALLLVLVSSPLLLVLPGDFVIRGLTPMVTIGLGLVVWAVAERSAGLLLVALLFFASTLVASIYDVVNVVHRLGWDLPDELSLLPNLALCAAVLLLSAAAFQAVERRGRSMS